MIRRNGATKVGESWLGSSPNAGSMLFATIGASIVAIIFLTNWPTYHFDVRGGPVAWWYFLLPVLITVPIVFAEPAAAMRFFREPLFWWCVVYVGSGLLWLLPAQHFAEEANREWQWRLLALGLFYTCAVLCSVAKRPLLALVILGCVVFVSASIWFDALRPHRFVPKGVLEGAVAGRGAGTFIDPNAAAAFVVMGAIAVLPFVPRYFRGALLLGVVVGVSATFSRSGFVLAAIAAVGAIALRLIGRAQALLVILAIPLLVSGIALSYEFLESQSEDKNFQSIVRRLAWFEQMDEDDDAVEGRRYGASVAWKIFLDDPLLGGGTGATFRAINVEGPHNMYLGLMGEQGVFGLALYLSLVGLLARRGWGIVRAAASNEGQEIGRAMMLFALFLAAYGLFNHNVLKEPHTMFVLAFLVAAGFHAQRTLDRPAVLQRHVQPRLRPARW